MAKSHAAWQSAGTKSYPRRGVRRVADAAVHEEPEAFDPDTLRLLEAEFQLVEARLDSRIWNVAVERERPAARRRFSNSMAGDEAEAVGADPELPSPA